MWDDDEFEDEEDDSGETTAPCPHCGAMVYDDAERCPACERYLSFEDRPWNPPKWILAGVIVCLGIVAWWTLG